MTIVNSTKYCFDSSALIDSWRRYYPRAIFPTLWEKLATLMSNGRIIIPKEVKKEILAGNDDLRDWFKKSNPNCFPLTEAQISLVREIVNKYPKVSQYHKPRSNHADPFVVALAKLEGITVVTWEGGNGSKLNPGVPDLCREYGVTCFNMISFFEEEGWEFKV